MLHMLTDYHFADFLQHKDAYQVILDGVKGGPKEKRLAAQFIPKFFSSFPDMADTAINAQLDLCEDEDVSVSVDVKDLRELHFNFTLTLCCCSGFCPDSTAGH